MKKKILIFGSIILMYALSGCEKNKRVTVKAEIEDYQKNVYESVDVEEGNIEPIITLRLKTKGFERNSYYVMYNDLTVDKVFVAKGDRVNEGQTLITFKSEEIEDELANYNASYEEKKLMVDHFTNLMKIDTSCNYEKDIKDIKEKMEIDQLYINELNAKLDSYSITALRSGTVDTVSELLDYGTVKTTDTLVTVVSGSGEYTANTTDDYEFELNKTYLATFGIAQYEMVLVAINEGGIDAEGNAVRELTFEPLSDMAGVTESDTVEIIIHKEVLKNVVYIPKEAVFEQDEHLYVYVLDENGFRDIVEVKVKEIVDGFSIIEEGLSKGEKVVIK